MMRWDMPKLKLLACMLTGEHDGVVGACLSLRSQQTDISIGHRHPAIHCFDRRLSHVTVCLSGLWRQTRQPDCCIQRVLLKQMFLAKARSQFSAEIQKQRHCTFWPCRFAFPALQPPAPCRLIEPIAALTDSLGPSLATQVHRSILAMLKQSITRLTR